jgi:GDP-L-fucose synthase
MRVAILGSKGLVGDAFTRLFPQVEVSLSRADVDICNQNALSCILKSNQIDIVINCGAKVGGINLNKNNPFRMFSDNIQISQSVLHACIKAGVVDLVQFCSNCSYPTSARQPYVETSLLNGPPHNLNKGYAAAKIAAVQAGQCAENEGLIRVYHPIPCSLFGFNDNYSLNNSHFVAAVVRKIYTANINKSQSVEFWGSGKPCREFMFVDNLPSAVHMLLKNQLSYSPVNIGTSIDTPIKNIIEHIVSYSHFNGDVIWDISRPDGAMHKLLDSSRIAALGWSPTYDLYDSLSATYTFFSDNQKNLRL